MMVECPLPGGWLGVGDGTDGTDATDVPVGLIQGSRSWEIGVATGIHDSWVIL